MPTGLDVLFVALFAVAWPLYEHFLAWPGFLKRAKADPAGARLQHWSEIIGKEWGLVALGIVLWLTNGRSASDLGLIVPTGWRLWLALGLVVFLATNYIHTARKVARSEKARASVREQVRQLAVILPHSRSELLCFLAVAVTAGFCEEFLYRGYFLRALTPWLGWWGAAALSVPFFGAAHAYQGWNGILRTGLVGVAFVLTVAVFDSLIPAIVLHIVVDAGAGLVVMPALRGETAADPAAVTERKAKVEA
jgi:membrane protease YdiL (CAAX protease family)